MLIRCLVLVAAVLSLAAVPIESGAAADAVKLNGNLVLKPDSGGATTGIVFNNGDVLTTAPTNGKSVLSGSGSPIGVVVGNIGDFYIDTLNHLLYGPYAGSWGAGVSLVGPAGAAGVSPFTQNGSDAVYTTGSVGIGLSPPNAKAALDVSSITKGFLPPRMTTVQRDAIGSPPAGLMIYNTTTGRINVYNGSAWSVVALVQQDQLGQTAGSSSFNSGLYFFTGYVATNSGTIASVKLGSIQTGDFQLFIMDAGRNTLRTSSLIPVSGSGVVTIAISPPVTINAGEYIGFYYTGIATALNVGSIGNTYSGSTSTTITTPRQYYQMSIQAMVDYIN